MEIIVCLIPLYGLGSADQARADYCLETRIDSDPTTHVVIAICYYRMITAFPSFGRSAKLRRAVPMRSPLPESFHLTESSWQHDFPMVVRRISMASFDHPDSMPNGLAIPHLDHSIQGRSGSPSLPRPPRLHKSGHSLILMARSGVAGPTLVDGGPQ
jgi:hypothetical protein